MQDEKGGWDVGRGTRDEEEEGGRERGGRGGEERRGEERANMTWKKKTERSSSSSRDSLCPPCLPVRHVSLVCLLLPGYYLPDGTWVPTCLPVSSRYLSVWPANIEALSGVSSLAVPNGGGGRGPASRPRRQGRPRQAAKPKHAGVRVEGPGGQGQ